MGRRQRPGNGLEEPQYHPARAALLAALALIGFACALLLITLLIRSATGPEVPLPTPTLDDSAAWIVRIEAVEGERKGYWVDRGWSLEARPKIVSVIDTVATEDAVDGRVPVGGIAWAGDRGIQKVELQIDGGEWLEARLRTPPLGPLTWVQWRYDWLAAPGRHTLRVRATDGTGALQTEKKSTPHPDGATGYHEVDARI